MKKATFITAALLTAALLSANNATDDNLLQQDLFSNYGGWVNLTAGYTRDTTDADPMKSEIAVCGNTVHVVWADIKSNTVSQPEGYDVWYRRSTDGAQRGKMPVLSTNAAPKDGTATATSCRRKETTCISLCPMIMTETMKIRVCRD